MAELASICLGSIFVVGVALAAFKWLDTTNEAIDAVTALSACLTLIIVLVTSIGARNAYLAVRRATVDRTTFELIQRYIHDDDLIELIDKFRSLRVSEIGDQIGPYDDQKAITFDKLHDDYLASVNTDRAAPQNRKNLPYEIVMQLLNFYEAVGVGIRNGAISEDMMVQWWRRTYVLDFIDLIVFIEQYRERKGDPVFCEAAQECAIKWAIGDEPEYINQRFRLAHQLLRRDAQSQFLYKHPRHRRGARSSHQRRFAQQA